MTEKRKNHLWGISLGTAITLAVLSTSIIGAVYVGKHQIEENVNAIKNNEKKAERTRAKQDDKLNKLQVDVGIIKGDVGRIKEMVMRMERNGYRR